GQRIDSRSPISRSHHHATNAVHPAAPPHAVLRNTERGKRRAGREQYSSEEFVELVMRTDPYPLNCVTGPFADSANVQAHSHRPIVRVASQLFEFKRWMIGIDSR